MQFFLIPSFPRAVLPRPIRVPLTLPAILLLMLLEGPVDSGEGGCKDWRKQGTKAVGYLAEHPQTFESWASSSGPWNCRLLATLGPEVTPFFPCNIDASPAYSLLVLFNSKDRLSFSSCFSF